MGPVALYVIISFVIIALALLYANVKDKKDKKMKEDIDENH